jgi:hypothetical protein
VSVFPGLLAALAIVYAIRHVDVPRTRDRVPIRLCIRPAFAAPGLGRLFAGVSAFELGNVAATLLILRASELLEPRHGEDTAATLALALSSPTTPPPPSPASSQGRSLISGRRHSS